VGHVLGWHLGDKHLGMLLCLDERSAGAVFHSVPQLRCRPLPAKGTMASALRNRAEKLGRLRDAVPPPGWRWPLPHSSLPSSSSSSSPSPSPSLVTAELPWGFEVHSVVTLLRPSDNAVRTLAAARAAAAAAAAANANSRAHTHPTANELSSARCELDALLWELCGNTLVVADMHGAQAYRRAVLGRQGQGQCPQILALKEGTRLAANGERGGAKSRANWAPRFLPFPRPPRLLSPSLPRPPPLEELAGATAAQTERRGGDQPHHQQHYNDRHPHRFQQDTGSYQPPTFAFGSAASNSRSNSSGSSINGSSSNGGGGGGSARSLCDERVGALEAALAHAERRRNALHELREANQAAGLAKSEKGFVDAAWQALDKPAT